MSLRLKFALIVLLAVVTALLAYPREDLIFKAVGLKNVHLGVQQGLDLKGGAQLVFQADFSKTPADQQSTALASLITVMERRADIGGTNEVTVQSIGNNRVSVSLPGVKNVHDAISEIGQTANLTFVQVNSQNNQTTPTDIDGKDVQSAVADYDPTRDQPVVDLTLKPGDSTKKFGDLTTQLSQSGNLLLAELDGQPTFGPATTQPITNGQAILSGNMDINTARKIADEITAGALPVPVTLVEQSTIGPTLGQESVQQSFVAGVVGLSVVALFMLLYYRLAGVLAVIALFIYSAITLTLYKLSVFVPGYTIVLTLAGIAGFILSIGMAVDANILIFERMKEEIRAGKSFVSAIEVAFDRAWTSIRDSNMSTLITCVILYVTSSSTPIIRGFAVTLGLGVLISMFTAVVVTRTLLRMTIRQKWGRNAAWYGVKVPTEVKS
jgi:preprotein translocase subunit SecD